MAIENMREMLKKAKQERYAVGAFNILDYNSMKAVVKAAEQLNSPVIVQTSVKTVEFWGFEPMIQWFNQLASKANVPVAIHLDHCKDVEFIRQCIANGWTSVMIDASSKPYEENLALTKQVVEMAKPKNVSVEAEMGAIVGVEDDIHVKEQDAHLADPEKAETFCSELELDCFAPAVGTAHGVYKGEPKIAFDLIEDIAKRTEMPLALHGGTGLTEQIFKKCISLGCAKVNISTQLKYVCIDSFSDYHKEKPNDYNPLNVFKVQCSKLKEAVIENIKLFGSEGKAN